MTALRLVLRGLVHRWRANLAVALGAALATAVLLGALGAGDSVRESLRRTALARLGTVSLAMEMPDRWVRDGLAPDLAARLGGGAAAVVSLVGSASSGGGQFRASPVHVLGVGDDFRCVAGSGPSPAPEQAGVVLNESLALRLGVKPGDPVILRVPTAAAMPADAPLSTGTGPMVSLTGEVTSVVADTGIGGFSLRVGQAQPLNAFVARDVLAARIGHPGHANMVVLAPDAPRSAADADRALASVWELEDAGLILKGQDGNLRLSSERVFIEPPVEASALTAGGTGLFTWFVDSISSRGGSIPYSFVAGVTPSGDTDPRIPRDLEDDEIVLNSWAARELSAKPGDSITLEYRVPGTQTGDAPRPESAALLVRSVVPIRDGDRILMPDFPGLAGATSCRDWTPGVAVDLSRITARDQAYWDRYRGSPKAFVTLKTARRLWSSRFGGLTAVRFAGSPRQAMELPRKLLSGIDPRSLGLVFRPVRETAIAASSHGVDFGTLFLGLSIFLVGGALLLTGLLFYLFVRSRSADMGILAAVGMSRARIFLLTAGEGAFVALAGAVLGLGAGLAAHRGILLALATIWRDAVQGAGIAPSVATSSVLLAFSGGFSSSATVLAVAAATLLRTAPIRAIQQAPVESPAIARRRWGTHLLLLAGSAAGASITALFLLSAPTSFFCASGTLLVAGIATTAWVLRRPGARRPAAPPTILSAAVSSAARRCSRSIAVAAIAACGILVVTAVSANRREPPDPARRDSGTGGFSLVAEAASPVGRKGEAMLSAVLPAGSSVVGIRSLPGDDASCLNLNRAAQPRLLGVSPRALDGRFTFRSVSAGMPSESHWSLLERDLGPDCLPAVVDLGVAEWGLGLPIGAELVYRDEAGVPLRIRLVAGIDNSIFQGSLLVSEDALARHFPSCGGHSMFLVEAAAGQLETATGALLRTLAADGASVETTAARLARFDSVENAYLAIFGFLGWLGLGLGALGTGVVAARNAAESRGELALLRAVGIARGRIVLLVVAETLVPLTCGIVAGAAAGAVAAVPAAAAQGSSFRLGAILVPVLAIPLGALLAALLASWTAARGGIMAALRND